MSSIGGLRVVLQTKDNAKLDGMYLSAQSFQQKCIESGAMSLRLQVPIGNNKQIDLSGLIIPTAENADEFVSSLERLKLFNNFDEDSKNCGAGWAKVDIGGQTAIVPDFEIQRLLDSGLLIGGKGEYSFSEEAIKTVQIDKKPLEINSRKSGTVVLGLGAAGVYEMYKREALFLLMQGTNVMLFNHRGQGESTGKPSEQGTYEDMDTVYQYLKEIHHVEDNQLVLRGLCLSGGIVSKLASSHPDINIILDQTYSDIKDITFNTVLENVKEILKYNPNEESQVKNAILAGLTPVLKAVASLVSPDYQTARHLRNHKGHVLVLRATEDTYMNKRMTDKILDELARTASPGINSRVHVGHMPGIHGASWIDAKVTHGDQKTADLGRYHMLAFLQECGAFNPFIDNGGAMRSLLTDYHEYLESQSEASLILIQKGFGRLPKNMDDVPEGFTDIPLDVINEVKANGIKEVKANRIKEVKSNADIIEGREKFKEVLKELERLKDRLGGSPTFGNSPPTIKNEDLNKTFLGLPLVAVKDWFRMILEDKWKPRFFWKWAASLFNVGEANKLSQYEDVHIRIQQFGCMVANKDRFLEILAQQDSNRYLEFGLISGLAWHPINNGVGVEKMYIEFVERFLTEDFKAAKQQGDDALIAYFSSFTGVCFEDRCRDLEVYANSHPLGSIEEVAQLNELREAVKEIIDIQIDPNKDALAAFNEVLRGCGLAFQQAGKPLTGEVFMKKLEEYQIFDKEFPTDDGLKAKPSLAQAHEFILDQIDSQFTLEAYSLEDFLETELKIFLASGSQPTAALFKKQLEQRNGANDGLNSDSAEVAQLIQGYIQARKLT